MYLFNIVFADFWNRQCSAVSRKFLNVMHWKWCSCMPCELCTKNILRWLATQHIGMYLSKNVEILVILGSVLLQTSRLACSMSNTHHLQVVKKWTIAVSCYNYIEITVFMNYMHRIVTVARINTQWFWILHSIAHKLLVKYSWCLLLNGFL